MRTRIKICGIRDVETARICVDAGADAIGLVFAPGSPREVTIDQAGKIVQALPAFVTAVGLFVDAPAEHIQEVCRATGITMVQLHGKESPSSAARLKELKITKAIGFDAQFATRAQEWKTGADGIPKACALVVDAPPGPGHTPGTAGGTGRAFDWNGLKVMRANGDWIGLPELVLAGGLTPQNVADAVRLLAPYAVDVSSGVESSRGIKSPEMIRAFCDAVRG